LRIEKGGSDAVSAAEAKTRRDKRTSNDNKLNTRRLILVLQRQQTERGAPHVRVSQLQKTARASVACKRDKGYQEHDKKECTGPAGLVWRNGCWVCDSELIGSVYLVHLVHLVELVRFGSVWFDLWR
jgi:hypothetical protein